MFFRHIDCGQAHTEYGALEKGVAGRGHRDNICVTSSRVTSHRDKTVYVAGIKFRNCLPRQQRERRPVSYLLIHRRVQ